RHDPGRRYRREERHPSSRIRASLAPRGRVDGRGAGRRGSSASSSDLDDGPRCGRGACPPGARHGHGKRDAAAARDRRLGRPRVLDGLLALRRADPLPAALAAPMRALIVEDEDRLARTLERGLREAAWTVDATGTVAEAWSLVKQNPYDAIVLD